ncbi:ATP-binding protein [Pelagicoccus sp. SDUM812003]|uniref:ATP-binding protein n=1 Tax=Pelagicoccus sp. SDUM812003 TaxID=3041267 RepID=UPI0028100FF9|nr:ATP-binding protein [Pelagicoccus sp. SDUM812003]MDQ8201425.1 ATP-binding protein [Pelagicoccus sp. SDUM812003]
MNLHPKSLIIAVFANLLIVYVARASTELKHMASEGIPKLETVYPFESGIRGRVHSIDQMPNGDLAILSESGLHIFDGTRWSRLSGVNWPERIVNISNEASILATSEGAVRVENNRLGTYDVQVLPFAEVLQSVQSVAQLNQQRFALWADTLAVDLGDGTHKSIKLSNWAGELFVIGETLFTVGGTDAGINRWDAGTNTLSEMQEVLKPVGYSWPHAITPRAEGGFWILTQNNQVVSFDGMISQAWRGNESLLAQSTSVQDLVEVRAGELAFGTSSKGILAYDKLGNLVLELSQNQGLDDRNVNRVGLDRQGGLWAASKDHLTRISTDFRTLIYDERQGVTETVNAIEIFNGRVYLGTEAGLIASSPSKSSAPFSEIDQTRRISDLKAHEDHLFIAGNYLKALRSDGMIYEISQEGGTNFWQPSAFPHLMLAGNYRGIVVMKREHGHWREQNVISAAGNEIFSMAESSDGYIWGSTGGNQIARLILSPGGEGEIELFSMPATLNGAWSHVALINDRVYLNTTPCSVWNTGSKKWEIDPQMIYFPGQEPMGFEQIFGYNDELAYVSVNPRSGQTLLRPSIRVRGDIATVGNAVNGRAKCMTIDQEGIAWIGGTFGLIRATDPYGPTSGVSEKPRIKRLQSLKDGELLPTTTNSENSLVLGPSQNSLRFEISFQHFDAVGRHQYQTMLEGLDPDWSDFSDAPFREITNLSPGIYSLKVRAQTATGQYSEIYEFPFQLEAPWWSKPIALLFYAACLLGLILLIVRLATRQQTRKARKLERLVQERTNELEQHASLLTERNEELKEKTIALESTTSSLTEALEQLKKAQNHLVDTARTAGKAEVAINVLHSVGNTLNSVNTSVHVIARTLEASKSLKLRRIAALLEENQRDIANYLATDPRGCKIPEYLTSLSKAIDEEIAELSCETKSIESDLQHIKRIVSEQQNHAKNTGVIEEVNLYDLFETAVSIVCNDPFASKIEFCNTISEDITVTSDRSQLLDIIVNLVSNSLDAIKERKVELGSIAATASPSKDSMYICLGIHDNGIGIEAKIQNNVFQHGFTTKTNGHGFGLHSAANSAKRLGGRLSLTSHGVNKGAKATLKIPFERKTTAFSAA